MRTYYTTAASTWGTQSYESYTGSSSSSSETQVSTSGGGGGYSYYGNTGESYYSSISQKSTRTDNYSTTDCRSSDSWATSFAQTFSSSGTVSSSDPSYTTTFSNFFTAQSLRYYTYLSVQQTLRNLTGSSRNTYLTEFFSSYYSDSSTFNEGYTSGTFTYASGGSSSTTLQTTYNTGTVVNLSTNVATTSSFLVGSYQVTVTASTTSETVTTTSLSSTRTYGSTSTGTNAVYTSTSAVGYTNNTVGISSFSTYTSSAASSTITVTFNPRVERMVAYERGTAERMFALTSAFENTTKLLSEAVSECNTYTDVALTVLTNTTSQFFNGLTSSSTTASSSFVSVYPAFTQLRGTYLALPPYTDAYFGGYNQGTTSVSFGEGVFDRTYSDAVFGFETTQRFTNSSSFSAIYTASVMRINPLIYLSFDSTTTDYQNLVLTYNTTSLANP